MQQLLMSLFKCQKKNNSSSKSTKRYLLFVHVKFHLGIPIDSKFALYKININEKFPEILIFLLVFSVRNIAGIILSIESQLNEAFVQNIKLNFNLDKKLRLLKPYGESE